MGLAGIEGVIAERMHKLVCGREFRFAGKVSEGICACRYH